MGLQMVARLMISLLLLVMVILGAELVVLALHLPLLNLTVPTQDIFGWG